MLGLLVRFVVSALVLLFTGFIVPGFEVAGFWNALLAAVAIAIIGYVLEALFGNRAGFGRGVIGFLTAAAVLYFVQFVIPTMRVSIIGALIAAFVIGLIDAFVPTELR